MTWFEVLKKALFIVIQCTWGIFQTLIGAAVFLVMFKYRHKMYRCAIDTRWNLNYGLSLGLFIFTPNGETPYLKKLRVHEYGHCIQSLAVGPLYLIIGLISIVWERVPYFTTLRRTKKLPYTACFVEAWASKWGEYITGEKAIWD